MSLRDALLHAGVVDKKAKKKAERALRKARKQSQGSRQREKDLARVAREAAAAKAVAAQSERIETRTRLQGQRAEAARALRVRQLIAHHHLRFEGGRVPFFHKGIDGRRVMKLWVPREIAQGLRNGALGIVHHASPYADSEYVVLPRKAAVRVQALDDQVIVFLYAEGADPTADPALRWADEL